ncbi:unnamed protein product [Parnassius mnemosyne]|uniref:Secreted protein n=1 Tax=Parnassius mnemosyne TaxID=213953 RepID=A0AAV1KBW9_9NEOP
MLLCAFATYLALTTVVTSRFISGVVPVQQINLDMPRSVLNSNIENLFRNHERVKRNTIVYNKCPVGYKRLPPPLLCVTCEQYQLLTGESC